MPSLCSWASEACCSGTVSVVVGTQLQRSKARSTAPVLAQLNAAQSRQVRHLAVAVMRLDTDMREPTLRPRVLRPKVTVLRLSALFGTNLPVALIMLSLDNSLEREMCSGVILRFTRTERSGDSTLRKRCSPGVTSAR